MGDREKPYQEKRTRAEVGVGGRGRGRGRRVEGKDEGEDSGEVGGGKKEGKGIVKEFCGGEVTGVEDSRKEESKSPHPGIKSNPL